MVGGIDYRSSFGCNLTFGHQETKKGFSMSSYESQLLRSAFIPTFLTSGFAILMSTLIRGTSGLFGAVLAQFVVIIFFVIHIAVSRMTRNLDPISTMAMALFSYFAKLFALGLLLWAIAKFTDRSTIDRAAFGVTAVALTVAWLWGEIASFMKLRLHLPLPQSPPKE